MIQRENIIGIAEKNGYAYKRQVRGMLRYAQSVLSTDNRQAV